MANNFITNNPDQKNLRTRLNTLIGISEELRFLVGYFYFSGWQEVYENLQKQSTLSLKILVGLQVDNALPTLVEYDHAEPGLSKDDQFNKFMTSMGKALNNNEMDTEEFYNQVIFFLEMIEEGRLIIRKTAEPNHAKLYLFKYNEQFRTGLNKEGEFITGSSNLTRSGLSGQQEFNVEISDHGYPDASAYFDEIWNVAIEITEEASRKKFLIEFVKHKSQAANVTPFEAYALILKTYLDLQNQKSIKQTVEDLLKEKGFKKYAYQTDAVSQAMGIIDMYNGVIIADVVGLGKSVISSMLAKNIGKRGLVICPPGLRGDKNLSTGWWGYLLDFKLYDWDVASRGNLEETAKHIHDKEYEIIIVDEAHYFRNQDTADYEHLMNICRGKKVILLSATPFNNSPADIFALLKLFIIPGKSGITLDENLEGLFRAFNYRFKLLSNILKNAGAKNTLKRKAAEVEYFKLFGKKAPIDLNLVRDETKNLANQIKEIMAPVVIRRNRIDLQKDFEYSKEVTELSTVKDPEELFYNLSESQSIFYDKIIEAYFGEEGTFKGAIYQPFIYETAQKEEEKMDEAGNRAFNQQKNLFDFMRRLVVKRFESSFGAFDKTIDRFIKVHQMVLKFIERSGEKYILDRSLLENIYDLEEEEINSRLETFEKLLLAGNLPKNNRIYDLKKFVRKSEFLNDIHSDLALFENIKSDILAMDLVNNDPKREKVCQEIAKILNDKTNKRKVIVFSEYLDTVKHLKTYFQNCFNNRVLVCDGMITKELANDLNVNFNAQHKGLHLDNYDVLLTSDKLSEGFNLNRAGLIINYDIPWNPTRVIQRVGRINRIGVKVFDELMIYNFFPSEVGADIVKSREIAAQKMFMIHNCLGEDAKIFNADEELTPSALFKKINENPDENGELNINTIIRNAYENIKNNYPEVIERIKILPNRVKSAKYFESGSVNVIRKKGLSLFAQQVQTQSEKLEVQNILFEDLLPIIQCEYDEPLVKLSKHFWPSYEAIKGFKQSFRSGRSDISLDEKANENLRMALKVIDPSQEQIIDFVKILLKDLRYYFTLPKWTIRRLVKFDSKTNTNSFITELLEIKSQLGENYLDEMIKRVEDQKLEVIIAVENVDKT